jgi:hypothetical protein
MYEVSQHPPKRISKALRENSIIAVVDGTVPDESFRFFRAQQLQGRDDPFLVNGGAIASYYFRRAFPGRTPLPSEMYKPRGKYGIALKVYSNDRGLLSSTGTRPGTLIFPKTEIVAGVRDILTLLREHSETGIVAEFSPDELEATVAFIAHDLETGEHSDKAEALGQIMDALHGM